MTPDVNVLVAAFRPDHPHHSPARAWLNDAVHQAAFKHTPLVLLGMVVTGFVRVTTNPRVFKQIDALEDVLAFVDTLLACPGVSHQASGAAWPGLRDLCLSHQASGNLMSDAWIATTVLQFGETLCTFDRDFTRLLPSDKLHLIPT
jgi:toxin-antitoxin system PIN domain toxin